ncbi:LuxR family transcriptional regulator [Bacillus sp. HMF5848]|uniref:response regulator transcription factor n=1 Tax=Bacillus sp. HMF5848 TaxID=2495421 RepID=UPI000F7A7F04|nr:helix-turn-helix transcriptional regulator [Bacillus sp. HMF5848]RSK28408.1 LuxR family transcriptional regulator [Bacillus sp. HMF5848]
MENLMRQYHNLQDIYSRALGLTIFVATKDGHFVTPMTGDETHVKALFKEASPSFSEVVSEKIKILSDIVYPVSFSRNNDSWLIAPILYKGKEAYYIWAGKATTNSLHPYMADIVNFASHGSTLLKAHLKENEIASFHNTIVALDNVRGDTASLLQSALFNIGNIDCIGFATVKNQMFTVEEVVGKNAGLLKGIQYSVQETFFEDVIASKRKTLFIFENTKYDMRAKIFHEHDMYSNVVFALSLTLSEGRKAFLFGTSSEQQLPVCFDLIIELFAKIFEYHIDRLSYKQALNSLYMKTTSIMEISRVANIAGSVEQLQYIVSDLLTNVLGKSANAIIFKKINNNEYYHYNYLTKQDADICRISLNELPYDVQENRAVSLMKNKSGNYSVCPIFLKQKIIGYFLATYEEDREKEIETVLTMVASISEMALQNLLVIGQSDKAEETNTLVSKKVANDENINKLLTNREKEILELIVRGDSNREISEKLFISIHTVKNHITNIFTKLGVTDRTQLIALMYRMSFGEEYGNKEKNSAKLPVN